MKTIGIRMTMIQSESVFEIFPQLKSRLGGGVRSAITASSRYRGDGGNSPHDPIRTQPETRAVHQSQRTVPGSAGAQLCACEEERRLPGTSDAVPKADPLAG